MKYPLWVAVPICLLLSCNGSGDSAAENQPPPPYKKYRKGKFFSYVNEGKHRHKYLIVRNDSMQTEVDRSTGHKSVLKISWEDSSHYELSYQYSYPAMKDHKQEALRKANVMKVTITGGNNEYYLYKSVVTGTDFQMKDTIWLKKRDNR